MIERRCMLGVEVLTDTSIRSGSMQNVAAELR